MHGAKWVEGRLPAQLLWENRHRPDGVETWSDSIAEDEVTVVDGIRTTTPARTALDIACRVRRDRAVAAIDALARATLVTTADVEFLAARYRGRRGIRRAMRTMALVDSGAESPRETWLRLILIGHGFPPPATQIPVHDEYGVLIAVLDMGWENLRIAAEYDGDHHRTDRRQFNKDIRRAENLREQGWLQIRVTAEDTEGEIVRRVRAAFARRV